MHQSQQSRLVTLPGQGRWMDVNSGQFLAAGRTIHVTSNVDATPIYLREGSLLPMQVGERTSAANDLADIELHVVLGRGSDAVATLDYVADDGLSYGYQRGERSVVRFSARREGDVIVLAVTPLQTGWKPLRVCVVGYDGASQLELTQGAKTTSVPLAAHHWCFSGALLAASASEPLDFAAMA